MGLRGNIDFNIEKTFWYIEDLKFGDEIEKTNIDYIGNKYLTDCKLSFSSYFKKK